MNADEGTQMNADGARRLAGTFAMMLASLGAAAHTHGEQWAIANEYPANTYTAESDELFAKLVADATQGKLSLVPMPGATLGYKSRDQLAAVKAGKVAMADTFAGALGEAEPLLGLSTLPFLVADMAQARALHDAARGAYAAAFARHGQKLLYATPWPPTGLWTKKQATTLAAVKALTVRAYDQAGVELFVRLGAKASEVSFSDLPAKLKAGEFTAALSSGDGAAAKALWDLLGHFDELNYAIPVSFTTVNLAKWNALDPALRKAVEKAAAEAEATVWQGMDRRTFVNYQRMRSNDMSIHHAPDIDADVFAALRESAKVGWEAWAVRSGPEGKALLGRAIDAQGKAKP
jgi:TRAP-type C4-dicarboxylate transport system substrate-binding protein